MTLNRRIFFFAVKRFSLAVSEFLELTKKETVDIDCSLFLKSDFDLASLERICTHQDHTPRFASANFYEGKPRYPMDDLESLIYSMWYIAGVPAGRPYMPFNEKALGLLLSEHKKNGRPELLVRVSS